MIFWWLATQLAQPLTVDWKLLSPVPIVLQVQRAKSNAKFDFMYYHHVNFSSNQDMDKLTLQTISTYLPN